MRKFILNLLTILAWIYQILCVLSVVMFGFLFVGMLIGRTNSDFRKGFLSAFNVHNVSFDQIILFFEIQLILMIIMSIAMFLVCRYGRLIIKNIKHEVYFAINNLKLLRNLLISIAVYTVFSVIQYVMAISHQAWLTPYTTNTMIYPGSIMNGLLFLAILYVVYLVFKYGMKVQEDADSII